MTLIKLWKIIQAEALKNPDSQVKLYWDYAPRGDVEAVYFNKEGEFVLAGESDYDDGDSPVKVLYKNHD